MGALLRASIPIQESVGEQVAPFLDNRDIAALANAGKDPDLYLISEEVPIAISKNHTDWIIHKKRNYNKMPR